jgi:coproporphyrinogen III oxidase
MDRIKAQSAKAEIASSLVEDLQLYFVEKLNQVAGSTAEKTFKKVEWFRDKGQHGGGVRYEARDEAIFNRASVNVSQVQYDDDSGKSLASATAISTIIHPKNPMIPSVHMHISWTEMKTGKGYWRLMADLNPSVENEVYKVLFESHVKEVLKEEYESAVEQGEQYFYIPVLGRHRGVSHFYLEEYNTGDLQTDVELARDFGQAAIDIYIEIFAQAMRESVFPVDDAYQQQLAYHTLYLFQVLTLDRGTTSGLLIHDQNDIGIMGSLPAVVDKTLLSSWLGKMQAPQDQLLKGIVDSLSNDLPCVIDESTKQRLAQSVRQHYKANPAAINMQAQGSVVPKTVKNHE